VPRIAKNDTDGYYRRNHMRDWVPPWVELYRRDIKRMKKDALLKEIRECKKVLLEIDCNALEYNLAKQRSIAAYKIAAINRYLTSKL